MLKYEKKTGKLLPLRLFYLRFFNNLMFASLIILCSLSLGIWGYMHFAGMSFQDGLLNASMILSGMGPVDVLNSNSAKYFASFYALFSGITFLTTVGILFAPVLHRAMHRFHLEDE